MSFKDPLTAKVAVDWFDGKDFQGIKLKSFSCLEAAANEQHAGECAPPPRPVRAGRCHLGSVESRALGCPRGPMGCMGGHGGERRLPHKRSLRLLGQLLCRRKLSTELEPGSALVWVWKPEPRLENKMQLV